MNTTFIINGGAGRVIAAIPALEKYARLNPDDDFKILIYGWESLFWSHPLFQNRTFSIGQKGVFQTIIKNSRTVCPEPYYSYGYYNQQLSLAEAFDEEINKTNDHSDLNPPKLYISTLERSSINKIIRDKKEQTNRTKTIVIQPYGSSMGISNNRPFDASYRSLDVDDYLRLVNQIRSVNKDVNVFYFGTKEFRHPADSVSDYLDGINTDLRFYLALISECDYFVGCDSVGQHIARAVNKSGLVIMGSTDDKNVSYPDYFTIYRNGKVPEYSPIRLSGLDCEFADRSNDGIMSFSDQQIKEMAEIINRNLYE
jgi:ADP-heptose:LPS heptosyltransferase